MPIFLRKVSALTSNPAYPRTLSFELFGLKGGY